MMQLMSVAWHPKRWWDWCESENANRFNVY